MMLLGMLLMGAVPAALPTAAPATAEQAEEIVVIAQRLERTKGQLKRRGSSGPVTCRVTATSGNPRIDGAVCEIAIACAQGSWSDAPKFRECVKAGRESFLERYFQDEEG